MAVLRPGRQERATAFFSESLALSLGVHALLAALILAGGGFSRPAAPPVMTVSLVTPAPLPPGPGKDTIRPGGPAAPAPPPGPPAAPPKKRGAAPKKILKKAAPKPAPAPTRPEPETVAPLLPPRPAPPPRMASPTPAAPPALAARPSRPAPSAASAAGSSQGSSGGASGSAAGAAPTGGGSGVLSRGASGSGSGSGGGQGGGGGSVNLLGIQRRYLSLVRARILAHRTYPQEARRQRQEGIVRLRFTVSAGGSLAQDVQVVKPSGFHLLDDQARHCVRAAAPFPPLPQELQRTSLTVELPIVYKITEVGT